MAPTLVHIQDVATSSQRANQEITPFDAQRDVKGRSILDQFMIDRFIDPPPVGGRASEKYHANPHLVEEAGTGSEKPEKQVYATIFALVIGSGGCWGTSVGSPTNAIATLSLTAITGPSRKPRGHLRQQEKVLTNDLVASEKMLEHQDAELMLLWPTFAVYRDGRILAHTGNQGCSGWPLIECEPSPLSGPGTIAGMSLEDGRTLLGDCLAGVLGPGGRVAVGFFRKALKDK